MIMKFGMQLMISWLSVSEHDVIEIALDAM